MSEPRHVEMVARRIARFCGRGDIRRGRRVLRSVQKIFRKHGGRFMRFEHPINMDALVFSGEVGGKRAVTAFTGLEAMQGGNSPSWMLECLERRFEVAQ